MDTTSWTDFLPLKKVEDIGSQNFRLKPTRRDGEVEDYIRRRIRFPLGSQLISAAKLPYSKKTRDHALHMLIRSKRMNDDRNYFRLADT